MQFPTGDKLSSIFAFTLMPFAKFEKLDRYLQCNVGVVVMLCVIWRADFSNLQKGLRVNALSKPVFSAMDWPVRARGRSSSIDYRAHSRAFCKVRKTRSLFTAFCRCSSALVCQIASGFFKLCKRHWSERNFQLAKRSA